MSKLGIGLLIAALLGAIAAAVSGFLLLGKYSDSRATIVQVQQDKATIQREATKAKQEVDAANQQIASDKTEMAENSAKLDDLNTKLAAAQQSADSLKTTAQQATDTATKAQADLKAINDQLQGQTPADLKAAEAKAEADLATAQSQQKIAEDQLQAAQKQVADLQDAINRSPTGKMPPGVSGKVTFVNRAWNFVVLNIGISNGVVPNGELIVYRGRDFLGKIRVTSAESTTAVADILPDAKADIQVGDDVLN